MALSACSSSWVAGGMSGSCGLAGDRNGTRGGMNDARGFLGRADGLKCRRAAEAGQGGGGHVQLDQRLAAERVHAGQVQEVRQPDREGTQQRGGWRNKIISDRSESVGVLTDPRGADLHLAPPPFLGRRGQLEK